MRRSKRAVVFDPWFIAKEKKKPAPIAPKSAPHAPKSEKEIEEHEKSKKFKYVLALVETVVVCMFAYCNSTIREYWSRVFYSLMGWD